MENDFTDEDPSIFHWSLVNFHFSFCFPRPCGSAVRVFRTLHHRVTEDTKIAPRQRMKNEKWKMIYGKMILPMRLHSIFHWSWVNFNFSFCFPRPCGSAVRVFRTFHHRVTEDTKIAPRQRM